MIGIHPSPSRLTRWWMRGVSVPANQIGIPRAGRVGLAPDLLEANRLGIEVRRARRSARRPRSTTRLLQLSLRVMAGRARLAADPRPRGALLVLRALGPGTSKPIPETQNCQMAAAGISEP